MELFAEPIRIPLSYLKEFIQDDNKNDNENENDNESENENKTKKENYEPIGLYCLSRMFYNMAVNYDEAIDNNKDDDGEDAGDENASRKSSSKELCKKMIQHYLLSIKLGDTSAYNNLGFYYEESGDYENMLKYYLLAIQEGDEYSMYNLADYYQKHKDFDNMKKYYVMAIELRDDAASMRNMMKYYNEVNDIENANKYCFMFMEKHKYNIESLEKQYTDLGGNKSMLFVNMCLMCVNALESIQNRTIQQKMFLNVIYAKCDQVGVYRNKVNLFTKLNHIVECEVCYETKLNIDLRCGHCFCTSCYKKLYLKPCPICRYY